MNRTRKRRLILDIMADVKIPSDHYKGGFGTRIRRQQSLLMQAAQELARWGRGGAREQADLFKGDVV